MTSFSIFGGNPPNLGIPSSAALAAQAFGNPHVSPSAGTFFYGATAATPQSIAASHLAASIESNNRNKLKIKRTRQRVDAGEPRNTYSNIPNYSSTRSLVGLAPFPVARSGFSPSSQASSLNGDISTNPLLFFGSPVVPSTLSGSTGSVASGETAAQAAAANLYAASYLNFLRMQQHNGQIVSTQQHHLVQDALKTAIKLNGSFENKLDQNESGETDNFAINNSEGEDNASSRPESEALSETGEKEEQETAEKSSKLPDDQLKSERKSPSSTAAVEDSAVESCLDEVMPHQNEEEDDTKASDLSDEEADEVANDEEVPETTERAAESTVSMVNGSLDRNSSLEPKLDQSGQCKAISIVNNNNIAQDLTPKSKRKQYLPQQIGNCESSNATEFDDDISHAQMERSSPLFLGQHDRMMLSAAANFNSSVDGKFDSSRAKLQSQLYDMQQRCMQMLAQRNLVTTVFNGNASEQQQQQQQQTLQDESKDIRNKPPTPKSVAPLVGGGTSANQDFKAIADNLKQELTVGINGVVDKVLNGYLQSETLRLASLQMAASIWSPSAHQQSASSNTSENNSHWASGHPVRAPIVSGIASSSSVATFSHTPSVYANPLNYYHLYGNYPAHCKPPANNPTSSSTSHSIFPAVAAVGASTSIFHTNPYLTVIQQAAVAGAVANSGMTSSGMRNGVGGFGLGGEDSMGTGMASSASTPLSLVLPKKKRSKVTDTRVSTKAPRIGDSVATAANVLIPFGPPTMVPWPSHHSSSQLSNLNGDSSLLGLDEDDLESGSNSDIESDIGAYGDSVQPHSSTLTPMHLRKAKLMFFYTRYPSSALLKAYFPDIRFNKNNTAQLVKWFSNFREFYYIQMEKYARESQAQGVQCADEIQVTTEHPIYQTLNAHYNRNNHLQVPANFRMVVEATLREFFKAIQSHRDTEPSWKKAIYKVINRLDDPIPDFFKTPNFLEQLE